MKSNIKINKYITYFILTFPLIIPEGIAHIFNIFYTIFYFYGKIISILLLTILYLSKLKTGRLFISLQLKLMIILAIYCLLISVIDGHGISNWASVFWPCIAAGLLIDYSKNDLEIVIGMVLLILEFWIYINLICLLIFSNGMYVSATVGYTKNWILGYKSSFQYLIFPGIILGWLYSVYGGGKVRFLVLLGTSLIEAFISENVMLFVSVVIIIIAYFFKIYKISVLLNPFTYSIIILLINLIFIFNLTLLINTKIGTAFLDFYEKSSTLGGRISYIWPITIKKIMYRPIFGYGVWSSDERRMLYLNRPAAIHAHNQLLEMLFIGGIIFIAIYTLFHIKMLEVTHANKSMPATRIITFGLFVFYCMMVVEIYMRHTAFPVWILIYLAFIPDEIDRKFRVNSRNDKKIIKVYLSRSVFFWI